MSNYKSFVPFDRDIDKDRFENEIKGNETMYYLFVSDEHEHGIVCMKDDEERWIEVIRPFRSW